MKQSRKVAFITGASRGIGFNAALAFADAGYDLVLTARTVAEGQKQAYAGADPISLPGSLATTADAARSKGAEVLTVAADILDPDAVSAAVAEALDHFGKVDVLLNNACYQGPGVTQRLMAVSPSEMQKIYQGNVLTPLALVQALLPGMIERGAGSVVNMASGSALHDPPAPADQGGWGFAYPASKAALMRMVPSLRVEHAGSGVRFWNVEPGFVLTEVMRANGFDDALAERFKPTDPEVIGRVIAWLATAEEALQLAGESVIAAPQLASTEQFLRSS